LDFTFSASVSRIDWMSIHRFTSDNNAVFWGVRLLWVLLPPADQTTSRTLVSELIGSVNTSAFVVTKQKDEPITSGLPSSSPEDGLRRRGYDRLALARCLP
jgi:hypothetical protein